MLLLLFTIISDDNYCYYLLPLIIISLIIQNYNVITISSYTRSFIEYDQNNYLTDQIVLHDS